MDLPWKTAAWDCTGQQTKPPFFHYHADSAAHVVQISRRAGDGAAGFNEEKHAQVLRTEREWNDWLDEPDSTSVEASLTVVICHRHPDPLLSGLPVRNPAILKHLPLPSEAVFKRIIEKTHIHQAIQMIINRGWPTMLRSEDSSGPHHKIYYNLRTTNTLESDTALSMTVFPSQHLTYAVLFGYTPPQARTILARLAHATAATTATTTGPFALLNTFVQLEKVARFEHVERHADAMAYMVENFHSSAARLPDHHPAREDDPRDLVGLAGEVTLLRNGLVSWAREMERFGERTRGGFDFGAGVVDADGGEHRPSLALVDAKEYLERTGDEYAAMVRKCEGLLGQVSMAFQMEMSSIARQEAGKLKSLAFLTMAFLPATFVATFMSMGLFNWHPKEGEAVMSRWWYIYFLLAGGITAVVFALHFYWPRITAAISRRRRKLGLDNV